MENIPTWTGGVLKPADLNTIADAIQKAEAQTSGEIVPMLVRRSSAVGHVPFLLAFIMLPLLFVAHLESSRFLGFTPQPAWLLAEACLAILLGELLARLPLAQRWCVPKHDRAAAVENRALVEFHLAGLDKTSGATGVLIFISLMERQVVVLADKGIASKLPMDTWKDVVDLTLAGIKQGGLGQGLSQAILRCGELLKPHFPIKPDDVNELENKLIIKE
jgi:putative membrane protein